VLRCGHIIPLEVLKEVGKRLDRAGIAYMITGSTAGNFYTVPRMTRDIDIVIELEPIVAPEDLILSKLEWAKDSRSEFQLTDVRNLLHSVQGLDWDYLARRPIELGVESLYREVLP
jgi:hypothetical protein